MLPLVRPNERAGVLSVLYVIAYLAMGLPAVLGGISVVHGGGVFVTAREYGVGVMALAAIAFSGAVWRKPVQRSWLEVPKIRRDEKTQAIGLD